MAETLHKAITDPEIHEPKGITSAVNGAVYVSNGAGTGVWSFPNWDQLGSQKVLLNLRVPDISTSGSFWIVSPFSADIKQVWSVIDGPITAADSILTLKLSGVSVTDGAITIANAGSAAGDVDSVNPSALNTVNAGQAIEVACNGGSTGTVAADLTILLELT